MLRRGIQPLQGTLNAGSRICSRGYSSIFSPSPVSSSDAVPEDRDWWMVEGVLISVQDIRTVKKKGEEDGAPPSGPQRYSRVNHMSTFQINPNHEDQRHFWHAYMSVYERARDEWEKVAWDEPNVVRRVDDYFFDEPLMKKKKKPKTVHLERKPFSLEEIQAAIRENVRHPVSEKNIEYRTAADTKWPF